MLISKDLEQIGRKGSSSALISWGGTSAEQSWHEMFFCSRHELSHEKCSEMLPEMFEPSFCESEKIPRSVRQISRKCPSQKLSGKEKAHKHKQIFPVTAREGGGGLPTGWGGVSRPVARGQKFMCCVRNPRNINVFVRVPGREESGSRPGGSVTGVTKKLFMCQMFMRLFWPLNKKKFTEELLQERCENH